MANLRKKIDIVLLFIVFLLVFCILLILSRFKLQKFDFANLSEINSYNKNPDYNEKNIIMQDDPDLVQKVKSSHLYHHSRYNSASYNNMHTEESTENGLISILFKNKILDENKRNGFFVEVGANDGKKFTCTRLLEKLNWNGLLVEGANVPYENLLKQNRRVWHSNAVISPKPYRTIETFYENPEIDLWGGITYRFYKGTSRQKKVETFPIYTLFKALDVTNVDLLILDIEGIENNVLRTLPFELININLIAVELLSGKEGPYPAEKLLSTKGFKMIKKITVELPPDLRSKISQIITQSTVKSVYYIFKKV